ncbi:MAG: hypothetical protein DRP68_06000, partial [Candidatus Omnitrophota bacterium]
ASNYENNNFDGGAILKKISQGIKVEFSDEKISKTPSWYIAGYEFYFAKLKPFISMPLNKNFSHYIKVLRSRLRRPSRGILTSQKKRSLLVEENEIQAGEEGVIVAVFIRKGSVPQSVDNVNNFLVRSPEGAELEWKHISEMIPNDPEFATKDMYYTRPQILIEGYRFNFWYAGPYVHCGIHNHSQEPVPFKEIHLNLIGTKGGMVKYTGTTVDTEIERIILLPGEEHGPFWTIKEGKVFYGWHAWEAGEDGNLWVVFEDVKITSKDSFRDGGISEEERRKILYTLEWVVEGKLENSDDVWVLWEDFGAKAVEILIEELGTDNIFRWNIIVDILVIIGDSTVAELSIKALENKDWRICEGVVTVLGKVGYSIRGMRQTSSLKRSVSNYENNNFDGGAILKKISQGIKVEFSDENRKENSIKYLLSISTKVAIVGILVDQVSKFFAVKLNWPIIYHSISQPVVGGFSCFYTTPFELLIPIVFTIPFVIFILFFLKETSISPKLKKMSAAFGGMIFVGIAQLVEFIFRPVPNFILAHSYMMLYFGESYWAKATIADFMINIGKLGFFVIYIYGMITRYRKNVKRDTSNNFDRNKKGGVKCYPYKILKLIISLYQSLKKSSIYSVVTKKGGISFSAFMITDWLRVSKKGNGRFLINYSPKRLLTWPKNLFLRAPPLESITSLKSLLAKIISFSSFFSPSIRGLRQASLSPGGAASIYENIRKQRPKDKSSSSRIVEELNGLAQEVERYISLRYKWSSEYKEESLLKIYIKALSLRFAGELVDTSKLEIQKGDVLVAGDKVFIALSESSIEEIWFSTYSRELSLTEGCKDNLRFSDIPKEVWLLKLSRQPAFVVSKDGGNSAFWVGLTIDEEREEFVKESEDREAVEEMYEEVFSEVEAARLPEAERSPESRKGISFHKILESIGEKLKAKPLTLSQKKHVEVEHKRIIVDEYLPHWTEEERERLVDEMTEKTCPTSKYESVTPVTHYINIDEMNLKDLETGYPLFSRLAIAHEDIHYLRITGRIARDIPMASAMEVLVAVDEFRSHYEKLGMPEEAEGSLNEAYPLYRKGIELAKEIPDPGEREKTFVEFAKKYTKEHPSERVRERLGVKLWVREPFWTYAYGELVAGSATKIAEDVKNPQAARDYIKFRAWGLDAKEAEELTRELYKPEVTPEIRKQRIVEIAKHQEKLLKDGGLRKEKLGTTSTKEKFPPGDEKTEVDKGSSKTIEDIKDNLIKYPPGKAVFNKEGQGSKDSAADFVRKIYPNFENKELCIDAILEVLKDNTIDIEVRDSVCGIVLALLRDFYHANKELYNEAIEIIKPRLGEIERYAKEISERLNEEKERDIYDADQLLERIESLKEIKPKAKSTESESDPKGTESGEKEIEETKEGIPTIYSLEKALKDEDRGVRYRAAKALGKIDSQEEEKLDGSKEKEPLLGELPSIEVGDKKLAFPSQFDGGILSKVFRSKEEKTLSSKLRETIRNAAILKAKNIVGGGAQTITFKIPGFNGYVVKIVNPFKADSEEAEGIIKGYEIGAEKLKGIGVETIVLRNIKDFKAEVDFKVASVTNAIIQEEIVPQSSMSLEDYKKYVELQHEMWRRGVFDTDFSVAFIYVADFGFTQSGKPVLYDFGKLTDVKPDEIVLHYAFSSTRSILEKKLGQESYNYIVKELNIEKFNDLWARDLDGGEESKEREYWKL